MSLDIRRERSSSKRKGRDGPEESSAPRKKQSRKAADSDDEDIQMEDAGSGDEKRTKSTHKPKGKSAAPREEKEYPSINDLKKRIRDVKRLLNKQNLPADARIVQERALAGYEEDLAEETARRERSSMISKYHFVRFLDRKTANKQLNRLLRHEKDDKLDSKKKKSLERKIHAAQVNLNYTIYYPLTEKYISLYPKSKGKTSDDAGAESGSESDSKNKKDLPEGEKPALWSVVEKCMKEKTLDSLREGKLNIGFDGKPATKPVAKPAPAPAKKSKSTSGADDKKTKKTTKQEPKEEEPEPEFASRRERRAYKRDQLGQREHQRGQGKGYHHVAAPADGNESDGGFFE
ncbi:hypothetical protein N7509_009317 [Penicillium cosmopolitanum]|uniref:rRNA-processing protein EFG1 n=1 Tax=Penicillium cosmopolitanum TaxID=1131564 RepID=A0A9W9VP64_9EURO|nr:uncharacterized protein N7509_009317 [Penicillium cosmopolitanum]KAJ5386776.1 hypothetical protein N7509_009317 [Penicillium cosmopolitanum]